MAKLYYGNGNCSIEGSDAIAIQIKYSGLVEITDKTTDAFALVEQSNGIMIFPVKKTKATLNELFDYEGDFRVTSVITSNKDAKKISTTIHKIMDYSELLGKSETLTLKSEEMASTYQVGKKIQKTSLNQKIIPNLNTSNHNGDLYLKNGDLYEGYFHIHLEDSRAMTGAEHSAESKGLYIINKKTNKLTKTQAQRGVSRTDNAGRSSY